MKTVPCQRPINCRTISDNHVFSGGEKLPVKRPKAVGRLACRWVCSLTLLSVDQAKIRRLFLAIRPLYILLVVIALSGCSPSRPSAMDVQSELETYYRDYIYTGEDGWSAIVRCPTIKNYAWNGDDNTGTARFQLSEPTEKSGGKSDIFEVGMKYGNRGWYIPREAGLLFLRCNVTIAVTADTQAITNTH